MNPTPDNPQRRETAPAPGSMAAPMDETLRLIAHVQVPEGLEARIHAALLKAAPRGGRVLAWPTSSGSAAFWGESSWMRATAAAAIVLVVAGGGWGVYMHVEHPVSKVIVMPVAQPAAGGGFSSAGTMRKPQTVKGPVLAQPAEAAATGKPDKTKLRKKTASRPMPAIKPSPATRPTAPAAGPASIPAPGAKQ